MEHFRRQTHDTPLLESLEDAVPCRFVSAYNLERTSSPGRPLGTAIKPRYLDPHVPEVNAFANWLNRLFFPAG